MKKFILLIMILGCFTAISPVFSQTGSDKNRSEFSCVNIPVEKVFTYKEGYVILYRQGFNKIGTLYLPNRWFMTSYDDDGAFIRAKAQISNLPAGREWPTLSIFYKEGEFSHARLYVHRSKAHRTWGVYPVDNIDHKFQDIDDLVVKF